MLSKQNDYGMITVTRVRSNFIAGNDSIRSYFFTKEKRNRLILTVPKHSSSEKWPSSQLCLKCLERLGRTVKDSVISPFYLDDSVA